MSLYINDLTFSSTLAGYLDRTLRWLKVFLVLLILFITSMFPGEAKSFKLFNRWTNEDEKSYQILLRKNRTQCNDLISIYQAQRSSNTRLKINWSDKKVLLAMEKCNPGILKAIEKARNEYLINRALLLSTFSQQNNRRNIRPLINLGNGLYDDRNGDTYIRQGDLLIGMDRTLFQLGDFLIEN